MPHLEVNSRIAVPLTELDFTFVRSSGPGGQNVNKVSSKAVLRWNVSANRTVPEEVRGRFTARYGNRISGDGELVLSSQRYRDQGRNVADCLEKLRAMLAEVAVAPRPRKKSRPSRAAIERRLQEKKQRSQRKEGRRFRPPED